MADEGAKAGSFWTTLPGILTGAAALITAISGLAVWQHQSNPTPTPTPAPVIQQNVQPQTPVATPAVVPNPTPAAAGNINAPKGSKDWCAAKYKDRLDLKANTGADDAGLRKELTRQHCNKYGFYLGRANTSR